MTPAPAFLVTRIRVHDAAKMIRYAGEALAMVERFGGQPLADSFGGLHTIEGRWDADLMTLQRWPSMERFHDFYHSAEYRPLKDLRLEATDSSLALFEGGDWRKAGWHAS